MTLLRGLMIVAAALMVSCWPTVGNAVVFNFYWTGNPGLDSTILSSDDATLQAIGTIDINASAGSSFTLADIVSTNISVTGSSITNFVVTGWAEAGGTISGDGLSATFNAAGNPFSISAQTFFGCNFAGCGDSPGLYNILAYGDGTDPEQSVFYGSALDALASMHMTVASETPLPAAFPLFASGLGAFGLLGWRRKRKKAAALAA